MNKDYNAAVDAAIIRMLSVRKDEVAAALAERGDRKVTRPYAATDGRTITLTPPPLTVQLGDILANKSIRPPRFTPRPTRPSTPTPSPKHWRRNSPGSRCPDSRTLSPTSPPSSPRTPSLSPSPSSSATSSPSSPRSCNTPPPPLPQPALPIHLMGRQRSRGLIELRHMSEFSELLVKTNNKPNPNQYEKY